VLSGEHHLHRALRRYGATFHDDCRFCHFVSSAAEEITSLFRDVLLTCDELGLIGRELFAIDGCKLPSNASKEWSGTRADLQLLETEGESYSKLQGFFVWAGNAPDFGPFAWASAVYSLW